MICNIYKSVLLFFELVDLVDEGFHFEFEGLFVTRTVFASGVTYQLSISHLFLSDGLLQGSFLKGRVVLSLLVLQ